MRDEWHNGRTVNIYNIAPRSVWHDECITCGGYIWRSKVVYSPRTCRACTPERTVRFDYSGRKPYWVEPCVNCKREHWNSGHPALCLICRAGEEDG